MNNSFRYDINGLRAYAVMLVVLFHFKILGFTAGFIGVDIFFVISGFLMTNLVVKNLEKNDFSLFNFYLARGIRIVPALFIVCSVILIIGWFYLLPPDYKALAKHTLSSINFYSNITYWKESGYFDTDSHNKALLHTWSLSIEWQFYLIFPIVVSLLYKIKKTRRFMVTCLLVATLTSFVLSIFISRNSPSAGFYLLPTRAWEMLAGGLVFFISTQKIPYKKALEFIGFFLIAFSCYVFTTSTPWPSYNALLPTIGTCLVLLSNQQNSIFSRGRIFQWLGNTSYSIYLWHWPIVFFIHYFYKTESYAFIISGIFMSIFLGWISYKLIEYPTRNTLSKLPTLKTFSIWIFSVAILSASAVFIQSSEGLKHRFSEEISSISLVSQDVNPRKSECHSNPYDDILIKCKYGDGPLALIVIGDSHADALLNGLIYALPKNNSLISYTISGCSTILDLKRSDDPNYKCGNKVSRLITVLDSYPPNIPVIIINRINVVFNDTLNGQPKYYTHSPSKSLNAQFITEMESSYLATLQTISKNRKTFLTSPIPEADFEIPSTASKIKLYNLSEDKLKITKKEYLDLNKEALLAQNKASLQYGINIVDLSSFFCDQEFCKFTIKGIPLFFDADHMSWNAAKLLAPIFNKEIFNGAK